MPIWPVPAAELVEHVAVDRLRGRFETAVRARVLWRGERAVCDVLADLLAAAGVAALDADAVRIADRHAPPCAACSERRDLQLTSTTPAVSTLTTSTVAAATTTLAEPVTATPSLSASTVPSNGGPPPKLSRSVTGPGDYSVVVALVGIVSDGAKTVPATTATGSGPVCPGALTRGQCLPSARQPSYDDVFTVTTPDGTVLLSRTVTLTRT